MYKLIIVITLLAVSFQVQAIGFSLGVTTIFGQLANQTGAKDSDDNVDAVLRQLSTQINQTMPVNIDQTTRLDNVSAEPGKHFTYHYTITTQPNVQVGSIDFSKEIKPQLKSELCGNADNQKFLKNGVTVAYLYKDKSGREMGGAEFTPSECGFKS